MALARQASYERVALKLTLIIGTGLATWLILSLHPSWNMSLGAAISLLVVTLYALDRAWGVTAAVAFYLIKIVLVRVAHMLDGASALNSQINMLSAMTVALLMILVALESYRCVAAGRPMLKGRTPLILAAFGVLNLISVLYPTNSLTVGIAGFVKVFFPTAAMVYLAQAVFEDDRHIEGLLKVLMAIGVLSTIYGLGQFVVQLYPWEIDWFRDVGFRDGYSGWLTVGVRGAEFRTFSIFFNFQEFVYTNTILFAIAIGAKAWLTGLWQKVRTLFMTLWILMLLVTLDRMGLIMASLCVFVYAWLNASSRTRWRMALYSMIAVGAAYAGLSFLKSRVEASGIDSFVRLGELTSPWKAGSIAVRMEDKWGPALETIMQNPLGVGVGQGSTITTLGSNAQQPDLSMPHSEVLQRLLEVGVPGLVVFVLLMATVYHDALRLGRRNDRFARLGTSMAAASVALWTCGLVNGVFHGARGILYWTMAGVILALLNRGESTNSDGGLISDL